MKCSHLDPTTPRRHPFRWHLMPSADLYAFDINPSHRMVKLSNDTYDEDRLREKERDQRQEVELMVVLVCV